MQSEKPIVIAATFTAEPVKEAVQFWLGRMGMPGRIAFAPQNQLLQTLLDPKGPFTANAGGMNVLLLRWEDLDRSRKGDRPLHDLADALDACRARAKVPHLLITCPAAPSSDGRARRRRYPEWERELSERFAASPDLSLVTSERLQALYPVPDMYDFFGERLASIPYSPAMFAAIGTMIVRKFHVFTTEPYKAIVVDCDDTLWGGACGEDGPSGLRMERRHLALQEFLVAQSRQGVLVCLCSKNNEEDVEAVFRRRTDMPLTSQHIATRRVNWGAKSENILSIAEELGLAPESFIFVDDNPIECEAVRRALPHVLTLRLPSDGEDVGSWLERIWAFDRLPATNEDRNRTLMYRQARERARLRQRSATLEEFIAGLDLKVRCVALDGGNLARAAQLTFRVNQFNFTTVRRTEAELKALLESGMKGFVAEVGDRFGDYGSVGLVLYETPPAALRVETFVLSCRALGRGVEHRIVAELATVAKASGLSAVELRFVATAKNRPAQDFLEQNLAPYRRRREAREEYSVPVEDALALRYRPGQAADDLPAEEDHLPATAMENAAPDPSRAERLAWIATEMLQAERILAAIEDWKQKHQVAEQAPFVAPRTEAERLLADLWAAELGIEKVGIHDNFYTLGGDSLMMVRIVIKLYGATGVELPLSVFLHGPTIEAQAATLASLLPPTES